MPKLRSWTNYIPFFPNVKDLTKKIKIILYKSSLNDVKIFNIENIDELSNTSEFKTNKQTALYIGGYRQRTDVPVTLRLISSYLSKQNIYNVLQLDWSKISTEYLKILLTLSQVGKITAKGLNKLLGKSLNPTSFQIIGHSMGAHLAGQIGRNTTYPIAQIVGLDPAGPLIGRTQRLQSGDADAVVALHTDLSVYGSSNAIADTDFYANGGYRYQPGCPKLTIPFSLSEGDVCSHHRSVNIWAAAVKDNKLFVAVKKTKNGFSALDTVYLAPDTKFEPGLYYFNTTDKPPYGMGTDGILPYLKKETKKTRKIKKNRITSNHKK